jgi:aspartyl-tRNA(Asn)/glutamyl-tRNA(Gln) amidotransferase subunit C
MEIDIKYVANLARIRLTDKEIERFSKQLKDVLKYIDKLKELDITNIQPTSHVLPLKNIFREDVVKSSLNSEEVLKNAPQRKGNFFKVPKVL